MKSRIQWINEIRECYNKKHPIKELNDICEGCSGYDKSCKYYTSLEKEILYRR